LFKVAAALIKEGIFAGIGGDVVIDGWPTYSGVSKRLVVVGYNFEVTGYRY
jgi:hypothetical protein